MNNVGFFEMEKRILRLLWVFLLPLAVFARGEKELFIYHTNDLHSRGEPFTFYFPETVPVGKAGRFRLAHFNRREPAKHTNMLLFSSRDFF